MLIVENHKGWQPTKAEVDQQLSEMKSKGFRTDWEYCIALETHALMFATEAEDACLIAYNGKFLMEDEYYEA